ncbi:MAG: hypothetical protein NTV21_14550 [Planctomycetota bacterium]|nr:hypothetical protein [Planctomycetota bacterium]
MKKLALALAIACASCATYKPIDTRLIPIATDAELVAEYRKSSGAHTVDPMEIDKVESTRFAVLDELCARWGVERSTANEITRGVVSAGIPERAVVVAWGNPVSVTPGDGGETWHYRRIAGQDPRRVVFRAGIVSEVYPPGGY